MSTGALVVDQAGAVQPRAIPALAMPVATGHRLDQLMLAWLIDVAPDSANSRDAYGRDAVQFLGWCASRGLDPIAGVALPEASMFAGWLADAVPGRNNGQAYAPRTRRRKLAAVGSFYRYLHLAGAVSRNPWHDVRRPKRPKGSDTRSPELDLVVRMLDAAAQHGFRGLGAPCAEMVLALLFYLAVRASEACNIELARVDRHGRSVTFVAKGGDERTRPLPAVLREMIAAWLVVRPTPASPEDARYLLLNTRGRRISRQTVWRLVKRAARKAGLPDAEKFSPHSLRHAFNDLAKTAGFDIEARRDALGHLSTDTTELYTHVGLPPEDDPVHEVARIVHAARRTAVRAA